MKKWLMTMTFVLSLLIMCTPVSANESDTWICEEYQNYINQVSNQYSLCPEMVIAIVESESSGNANVINGNCKGLMQIYEKYHSDRMTRLRVTNLYDPRSNILVGCDYLAELFEEYGDMGTVLMIYNGSSDAIERGESANYTDYANNIMKRTCELERIHGK